MATDISSRRHYDTDRTTLGSRLRRDLGYTPVYLRYNFAVYGAIRRRYVSLVRPPPADEAP